MASSGHRPLFYWNYLTSAEFPGSSNSTVMGETGGFPMSIIVTGFFVTSLAYLVCFCCCVIQFFLRRRNNAARHPGRTGGSAEAAIARSDEQKNDTLKKRFLHQFRNSLRKLKKSRSPLPTTTGSSPSDPCAICLLEYTGSSQEIMIGYIAGCEHFFHFDCIWTWLEAKGNCPLCRQKVILKEEDIKGMSLKRVLQVLNEGQAARAQEKNSPPELQGVSVVSDQYSRQVNGMVISRDTNSVEGGSPLQGGGSHVWVSNPLPSDPSPCASYVPEIVCQKDSSSDAWPQGSRSSQTGGPMDNYAFTNEEQAPITCDVRSDTITAPNTRSDTITAPNTRSDTITAPNTRSDTITAPNTRSDTITAPDTRSDTITAPDTRSDTITAPDTSLHTHADSSVEHAGVHGRNIGSNCPYIQYDPIV